MEHKKKKKKIKLKKKKSLLFKISEITAYPGERNKSCWLLKYSRQEPLLFIYEYMLSISERPSKRQFYINGTCSDTAFVRLLSE